jgi:transcription-repair coupling factor (superfamily II helicase)
MDRLICGDVGFGKTEIAIRAAFKAVVDGKQAAVLVPTTILALQHFKTFSERLKGVPCTVDYINRFKSAKEQKETLQKLADGKIDIIIGTHRIVGKDVKFKDLGLLVIDEEQKFGVGVKDKLKTIKVNVDTLTLTATPIPRTLQFSMMGARDLSIINTPPPNRYPIQTELHSFNHELIRETIQYEVSRGGQVFFIHNRVGTLVEMELLINKLCPKVKTLTVHGQMDGEKLEEAMMNFINGDYDILISTTIVESGLDIPNANTMIINDAHTFGLSDLHQLRGRVGRSNKKAFCYLLAPPLSVLTTEAQKRLRAISEFSELGSGFQISMRDLDIRGAGNLLGAEQSGFITEIGYEMYQKILDEALEELREDMKMREEKGLFTVGAQAAGDQLSVISEKKKPIETVFLKDCQIDTDFELLIPDSYVSNSTERLSLYRELDDSKTEADLILFENRLKDRFGPLPGPTRELINTVRLRWMSVQLGFEKVVIKKNRFLGYFISKANSAYFQSPVFSKVLNYVQHHGRLCKMKEVNHKLSLTFEHIHSVEQGIVALKKISG